MSKCKICKNNYKFPYDTEPACNCMCENYNCFEPITNADRIKSLDNEDLAGELFNWFANGYDTNYMAYLGDKYDEILSWLQEPVMEA